MPNMFVGAGFNAFGIAAGGGAGWVLAQWVIDGEAPLDLWVVDIRRFSDMHSDRRWVNDRTLEAYGKHYEIGFPHIEYESGRPRIVSPLYDRLKSHRAVFGSKLGWERPNWFAPEGMEARDIPSMGRQNWFDAVGEEHRHVREKVGIFDQSSFAKYEISGPDALSTLSHICANDVSKPVGRLTYTQLLNTRGGIEADLTVARLAEDRFYVVTGTGFRTHDLAWIREHVPDGASVTIEDITETFGTLSLMGPHARHVLEKVTSEDVSNSAFPFGHIREIAVAGAAVRALRVTYVGELGWELHIPIDAIGEVFDALMQAGRAWDIRPVGYRALESLRLEKGYRAWGADITPNDTPYEAGLGWAVRRSSNSGFIGQKALQAVAGQPLTKRFAGFVIDDPDAVLVGRETILRNGQPVGYLTSGGYGYTIGKSIGYGYVRNPEGVSDEFLTDGDYELVIALDRVPAKIGLKPFFDPGHARVKA
jgi:sarcosine dehydrogenase